MNCESTLVELPSGGAIGQCSCGWGSLRIWGPDANQQVAGLIWRHTLDMQQKALCR